MTGGYSRYVGLAGSPIVSAPLDSETLRRFVQAIMDDDPAYFDTGAAKAGVTGAVAAPPLYPVHAFRRTAGTPDPLDSVAADPNADGTAGNDGVSFGLPPIPSPYKRLLNGGNEIEFHRCLRLGERAVARARYADVRERRGKSGPMLLVVIETEFSTELGELLLVNRQTLIWR